MGESLIMAHLVSMLHALVIAYAPGVIWEIKVWIMSVEDHKAC